MRSRTADAPSNLFGTAQLLFFIGFRRWRQLPFPSRVLVFGVDHSARGGVFHILQMLLTMIDKNLHDLLYCLEAASLIVSRCLENVDLRAQSVELYAGLLVDQPNSLAVKKDFLGAVESLRTTIADSLPEAKAAQDKLDELLKEVPEYWQSDDRPILDPPTN